MHRTILPLSRQDRSIRGCAAGRDRVVLPLDEAAASPPIALDVRPHPIPVARPQIGAEHGDMPPRQEIERRGIGGKPRKAEERRLRRTAGCAVDRLLHRSDTAVDFGLGARRLMRLSSGCE